ncbi:head GIN domain-containing protein [Pedobacter sp. UBA4863]|uniref:head GIN domain-containing protein n=1 Tax=Pedobacter sp. UBA4863 TaxID=1947060 RepID=UPI0025F034DF|nr:head GIN domain-containing protein [Pedobacter sp. UBA4863]
MKHFIIIILGLIAIINFSACKKDRLTANGNIISETRNLGQFNAVSSTGATPVKIIYGTDYNIVVKGSSNIIPYYNTRIVNNTLHIGFETANVNRDDIEVILTMPMIRKIYLSGSTRVEMKGDFPWVTNFDIDISGSGKVELDNEMLTDNIKVDISGSAEVKLENMMAKNAVADISGSGVLKIQVQEKLKVKISGSGKVYYKGSPTIQQDISGSGKLIKF